MKINVKTDQRRPVTGLHINGVLRIFLFVFLSCALLLVSHATATAQTPKYRQIVIATGSPFELGLVSEMGTVFGKKP